MLAICSIVSSDVKNFFALKKQIDWLRKIDILQKERLIRKHKTYMNHSKKEKLLPWTIQFVCVFLKRRLRWVPPVPVKGICWRISEMSSFIMSVKSFSETLLKCNWLKDCIIEFAWLTIPPALSPLSLLGNCRESRKGIDLRSIVRALPTICGSMKAQ